MPATSRRRLLLTAATAVSTGCLRFQSGGEGTARDGTDDGPNQQADGADTSPTARPGETEAGATDTAAGSATVTFETGRVDRDADGTAASGGVVATVQSYGGADSVQIIYRIPDQNAVLYRSERFPVADVQAAGDLGPRQRDPSRTADQLVASDIDSEGEEYGLYDGEHALVLFYGADGLTDSVVYEVGTGKLPTTVTTPPTDEDDNKPS